MGRSEALTLALALWGFNAFAVRAKETQRNLRYRVGFASNHEGQSRLYILGMGSSWEEAFTTARQHPMHEQQVEKTKQMREQFNQKQAELTKEAAQ